jgi:D-alanyl-D-alanine dipeptidase
LLLSSPIKQKLAGLAVLILAVLFAPGCQHGPPREAGPFRPTDLVELNRLDATLRLDIRYATTNNFMGRAMYRQPRAFLQRPAAEAVVRANQSLKAHGYGLLIFDGYRPWSVTKAFWDAATPAWRAKEFVANPRKGSRHNRGCAVDLTLYDLRTGREVEMPSVYDEFTERASPGYTGGTADQRARRDLLKAHLEAQGFKVYAEEWWHFDFRGWKEYKILDVPFERLTQ